MKWHNYMRTRQNHNPLVKITIYSSYYLKYPLHVKIPQMFYTKAFSIGHHQKAEK